ncbi:RNA polymerase sigma factor [Tamlana fucoidanivorans]|uniref:RNA polymerase sigma factor n=1 Tax=Allotamlana fucoidanivorans TaxID=2583814 RepID=A0A5C4SL67_9FLAO|nr:RNA polymerase sigma factor [Tamlana fucoidanivorans]
MKVIPLHKKESVLIQKAIKQNREAQRILFDLYAPQMLSVCRTYVKDIQHAEEVMLNGFLKVFSHLKNYRSEGSFEGWVRRIMVRESISFIRKQKQLVFSVEEIIPNKEQPNTIEADLQVVEIQQLIDMLPDGYKVVFVMYAIEGYKHCEIASLLHITEGTSKSQLYKARKMLQKGVKKLNTVNYGTN